MGFPLGYLVYVGLVDPAVSGYVGVMDGAQVEVPVDKAADPVAVSLVTFDLAVGRDQGTKDHDLGDVRADARPKVVPFARQWMRKGFQGEREDHGW